MKAHRRAVDLQPDFVKAWCHLGLALLKSGRWEGGEEALNRGHQLGSGQPSWTTPSKEWLRHCRTVVALRTKIRPMLSSGKRPQSAQELLVLGLLALQNDRTVFAADCYRLAFERSPHLLRTLDLVRLNATRAAARAGCGLGSDADSQTTTQRGELRTLALRWLDRDLELIEKRVDEDRIPIAPGRCRLRRRQDDPELAGVRDEDALARMPLDEQGLWRDYWRRVAAVLEDLAP